MITKSGILCLIVSAVALLSSCTHFEIYTAGEAVHAMRYGIDTDSPVSGAVALSGCRSVRFAIHAEQDIPTVRKQAKEALKEGFWCIVNICNDSQGLWMKCARTFRGFPAKLILEYSVVNTDAKIANNAFIATVRSTGKGNAHRVLALTRQDVTDEQQRSGIGAALSHASEMLSAAEYKTDFSFTYTSVNKAQVITDVACSGPKDIFVIYEAVQAHGNPVIITVKDTSAATACIREGWPYALTAFVPDGDGAYLDSVAGAFAEAQGGHEEFVSTRISPDPEYRLSVNGEDIPLYTAKSEPFGGIYYFCNFDLDEPASVKVSSRASLEKVEMLPALFPIERDSDGAVSFTIDRPCRIAIEKDGRNTPLIIFANPRSEVHQGDDVISFGPGVHHAGIIRLGSGQTLYLAPGAVVNAAIEASGDDITICGTGILTGDDWKRFSGPTLDMLNFRNCKNLTIKDVTVTNPWRWTTFLLNCENVLIENFKTVCSNMINDDALDLCNCSNVVVRDCFLRCKDDNIAIKGMDVAGLPCDNILIEDCQLWSDNANNFRIGYECDAPYFANIVARNLDIIHYSHLYRPASYFWCNAVFWFQPSGRMAIRDCRFENIRVHADGGNIIMIKAESCVCKGPSGDYSEGGSLTNIVIDGLSVTGNPDGFVGNMDFKGWSEEQNISGFELLNCSYFGQPVSLSSDFVSVREFVE